MTDVEDVQTPPFVEAMQHLLLINTLTIASLVDEVDWSECWNVWPHCCMQGGCWMHLHEARRMGNGS